MVAVNGSSAKRVPLMGRRIRWLGVIMVLCFGLVVVQLVNIQLVKAKQLSTSPENPRVAVLADDNARGDIYAADGTVLAQSVPTPAGNRPDYKYDYVRKYPDGPLYAGITGYDSALYYGTSGIEEQYDSYLNAHHAGAPDAQPAAVPREPARDHRQRDADGGAQAAGGGVAGADHPATRGEQRRRRRRAGPQDGRGPGHGLQPHLRPQRPGQPVAVGRAAGPLQLHPEGPRGLLPAAADRHGRILLPRVDHEGRDEHGGVQPEAIAGQLRLQGPAVPDLLGLEQTAV